LDTVEAFRSISLVAIDLQKASTHLPATQTRESLTPTSSTKSLLIALLSAYVALLLWMRNMAKGQPLPRFMGPAAREGARP